MERLAVRCIESLKIMAYISLFHRCMILRNLGRVGGLFSLVPQLPVHVIFVSKHGSQVGTSIGLRMIDT